MKILLTGASGYVGYKLLHSLVTGGHTVVCCVRDKTKFKPPQSIESMIEIVELDFLKPETLKQIPLDIDAAYYLIHSMASSSNYSDLELQCAINFKNHVENTAIKQVIYLGGITNENNLSQHLSSRKAVEDELKTGIYNFTTLRSGIIIGSGSSSFEIIRDLVEKLPVMVTPKWLKTKCQPIAVADVIKLLFACLMEPSTYNKSFDIGGPNILTYKQMLMEYARIRKLKRLIITIPVLTPRLSSYWLYLVTSTSYRLARALVNSMKVEIVCENNDLCETLSINPMNYTSALEQALPEIEYYPKMASTRPAVIENDISSIPQDFIYSPERGCVKDIKTAHIHNLEQCVNKIWSIGGENGWYYADWLWKLRAFLDKLIGGVGLGIGRTHPNDIKIGDKIDFWKVIYANKHHGRLILSAEMKVPGEAWLEFEILNQETLLQTATFRPRGIMGRLYWYALLPFHLFIFRGLIYKLTH
jgi:uncharacterized protein YbjT (DUF2867 family)